MAEVKPALARLAHRVHARGGRRDAPGRPHGKGAKKGSELCPYLQRDAIFGADNRTGRRDRRRGNSRAIHALMGRGAGEPMKVPRTMAASPKNKPVPLFRSEAGYFKNSRRSFAIFVKSPMWRRVKASPSGCRFQSQPIGEANPRWPSKGI